MEFIDENLLNYCEFFTQKETNLLKQLNRETHLKVNSPRMLSGHLQGRLLSFFSNLIQANCILEIGTYTGYSALCLAEGLNENGKLYTIDTNEETNYFASRYFKQSPYASKIELLQGDAKLIVPTLSNTFDLVFIDADKRNYSNYFDLVVDKVRKGGIIIADNVLWSGKVLHENKDTDTELIHAFNKKTSEDTRIKTLLLPIRDGLMVMQKL